MRIFLRLLIVLSTLIILITILNSLPKQSTDYTDHLYIAKDDQSMTDEGKGPTTTKKPPRYYKLLYNQAIFSRDKLTRITDLYDLNSQPLPPRKSDLSYEELCKDGTQCVPALKSFETEIRMARSYKLSACVVQKTMSTVLTNIFCFLHDQDAFRANNRDLLKDWKIIRFCQRKNEFTSMQKLLKKIKEEEQHDWTHIMLVRDPFERLVSGFVDKCYRLPVVDNHCNGCKHNLTCFMETEYKRMKSESDAKKFMKTYEDRHFFPQNWRCNLDHYFDNYTFIKYTSEKSQLALPKLVETFKNHAVPSEALQYINDTLSEGRTAHSTVDTKARKFIENRLRSSPYLMELLVKMFYHDYLLFGFPLPSMK